MRVSALVYWVTRGSNISLTTSEDLNVAYNQLSKLIYDPTLSPNDRPLISCGSPLIIDGAHGESCFDSAIENLKLAWRRQGAATPFLVCPRGPCSLSLFNVDEKDEGYYDLVVSKRNLTSALWNVVVAVSSVEIKISGKLMKVSPLMLFLRHIILCN